MLAVSHCQKVGIGEQDFEPGLSVIQESACCCVKPPSIASKSRACVGLIRTRGGGSPGPAQTATESWSCLPTSLGHHVLDLAFGAPAPSTACVLPLPLGTPWHPPSSLQRWASPFPLALHPCSCQTKPPAIRHVVRLPGGDRPWCAAPGSRLATAVSPALPSQALGSGRERDQVAAGISAQPVFEGCSLSPHVPFPAGSCGHKHRRLGKQSRGRGHPVPPAFLGHPLHPPIALVLMGLQLLPPSPAPPRCSCAIHVGRGRATGVPAQQCQPAGCQGAPEAHRRASPRLWDSGASSSSEHLSTFYLFIRGSRTNSARQHPCPRDTSVRERGDLITLHLRSWSFQARFEFSQKREQRKLSL